MRLGLTAASRLLTARPCVAAAGGCYPLSCLSRTSIVRHTQLNEIVGVRCVLRSLVRSYHHRAGLTFTLVQKSGGTSRRTSFGSLCKGHGHPALPPPHKPPLSQTARRRDVQRIMSASAFTRVGETCDGLRQCGWLEPTLGGQWLSSTVWMDGFDVDSHAHENQSPFAWYRMFATRSDFHRVPVLPP